MRKEKAKDRISGAAKEAGAARGLRLGDLGLVICQVSFYPHQGGADGGA